MPGVAIAIVITTVFLALSAPVPAFAENRSGTEQDDDRVTVRVHIAERAGDSHPDDGELPTTGSQLDLLPLAAVGLAAISGGVFLARARRPFRRSRPE